MAESESPSLSDILSQLEGKTTADLERRELYSKFSRHFTEDEVSLFSLDVAKDVNHVINVIQHDVDASSAEVSQGALQVLCVCLHEQDIVRNISISTATDVMKKLCACIHKTDDKTTCTRALWCLGKQNIAADIVKGLVGTVLDAVDFAVEKWGGNSITVEHECVNTIARLTEQAPKEITPQSARWGKVLLPLVAHNAIKVRERVLTVLEMTLDMLLANQKDLTASVVPIFKSKVCGELKKLLASKHEIYVLKCWGVLVQIFGEELHHGSFINSMLPIIELGFKGLAAETKMASFTAWQHLINNFATNQSILSDPKRIKLLMQVFKMNNAKTEDVAKVKLQVWWHLIWLLGNKISSNFDAVAAPMLQFCVGGSKLGDNSVNTTPRVVQNGISPVTPRMNLTCPNSHWPVFKSLQLKGCEVLAHFLGSLPVDFELPSHRFTLDSLRCEVITGPAMFVKNSCLFINTATELFISQGKDIPESLLFHIWYSLVAHMKNGIEGTAKLDMRETITTFLTQFQVIILSRVLSNSVILKMFEGVCCLPKKVLCSSAYNIGGGEMIHGTPALFLMELLLTPALLQLCPELESYHSLYSTIINSGLFNSSMSLGFLQAVLQILDQNASFVENSEMLWRFWSAVVQPLLEHITKTNEINQGDSLEHNFSCVYQALLFPLKHKLPALIPQPTVKTLTKTWTELYKTVNRLAAMVTNAEANIVCEDVCNKIMDRNKDHDNLEAQLLEFEISICHVVITSLDFSSLGTQSTFGLSASPAKWTKRRQRSLENINSLVLLLSNLQYKATRLVSEAEANSKKTTVDKLPLQGMLNTVVDNFSMLFTHVSSSAIISAMIGCLAQPIGELFHDVAKRTSVKVYNNAFQQKMEKLWMDITTCLQSRYQALFDSEFLQKLSPLLEATFLHSRRQIKNQTIALWNVTFGKAASLVYPEALKPVLSKVKDKSVISLPGWVAMAIPVIEETPISQMSQSQAPEPHIPGMPSPHKIHGSFLNKAVSPNTKKSPAKFMPSPKAASAKKKALGFDNFEEKDFVVIQSSPRKPRVLTDHQKEVMKERRILPAMYNSLENSQDVSMMAHYNTDTQDGSQSQTPTPTLEQPFSLFGSAIPPSVPVNKQEKNIDKMKPPEVKDSGKKTKTGKQNSKSPEPTVCGSTSTRRRSVRFKDEEKKPCPMDSNEPVELLSDKSDKSSEKELTNNKILTRSTSNSQEKTNNALLDNVTESKSVDNDIVEMDNSGNIKRSEDKVASENETSEKLIEKDLDGSTDKNSSDETKSQTRSTAESEKVSLSNQSIPQNVLGVIGLTPESSSKSAESKSDTLNKDDKELTSNDQDDESQPLFSWTQKLNQLNKSPRNKSPLKQVLSQETKSSSQRTSSQSPSKSPRRAKKKQGNETFGNLDKWIIRSPGKEVNNAHEDKIAENEIVVGSATIVEETQSPSKFARDKKHEEDPKMESVMETPPKHNFSGSNINSFGNSNRKLFQSSQDNIENTHDHVEDSNIIAASPNSKSFTTCKITGTPMLKLTRLTDSEIKKYSPSREGKKELELTPSKSDSVVKKSSAENKAVKTINIDGDAVKTKNSENLHRHDDFSAFKPLENEGQGNLEADGFFSKSLTDTEQAMLKLSEDERSVDSDSEKMDMSQSDSELVEGSQSLTESSDNTEIKGLFSQIVKEAKLEAEQFKNEMPFEASADIFTQDSRATDTLGSEFSQASQDESQKESKENVQMMESENESKTNRKRKQETPKKTTPEDLKKGRRKKTNENSQPLEFGSATKVSRRLQEKRERKETEKQSSSPSELKKGDKKALTEGKLGKMEDTKCGSQTIKKTGSKGSNEVSVEITSCVDSQTSEECKSEINTEIVTGKPMTDLTGNLISSKSKQTVSKAQKEQGIPNLKTNIVVAEKVSDESRAEKHNITNENMWQKQTESKCNDTATLKIPSKVDDLKLGTDKTETDNKKDLKKRKKVTSSQESIQDKGQKTPESRNSSAQPERKSTTKKKKAVAQKRVLKRESKDVVVNESDSNLDQEFSDDDTPLAETKKAIAENLEKKIDEQLSAEQKNEKKQKSDKIKHKKSGETGEIMDEKVNENNKTNEEELLEVHEAMDISFGSDDDIPLSNIKSSQEKKARKVESLGNKKHESVCVDQDKIKKANSQKNAKKEKETKTSPIGNKLRSSRVVKTRLRSGESKIISPPKSKKSLSLAVKRVNDAKKKLKVGIKNKKQSIDVSEIERDAAVGNEVENKKPKIVTELLDKENNDTDLVEEVKDTDGLKETETPVSAEEMRKFEASLVQVNDFAGMKDASTNVTSITDRPVNPVFNILDETPTKGKESPKRLATSLLMRNSDSKLVIGSRKFEKRPGFARRSILKPSSLGSASEIDSPKRTFHPIKVARIYSPTASPSASILKKRRLSGDSASDTNSPPAKQRRVSFAEPLTEMEKIVTENVTQSTVTSSASESIQLDKPNIPTMQKPDTHTSASTCNTETQLTQATPTPNTYQTQESQLNDSDPVCPELVGCDLSVEKILPQLTSSIWSRGLGQLVRARNIHTVGHLSALTESEIDSLPIRSPKVQTVRKVLGNFGGSLQAKKTKLWNSPKPATSARKPEEDQSSTLDSPRVKESSDQTGTTTTLVDDNEKTDFLAADINKLLESSGDLVDEVNRLSQKINPSQDSKGPCDSQSQSEVAQKSCDTQKDQPGLAQQSGDLQSAQSKFMDLEGTSTEEVGYPSPSNPLLSSLSELAAKFKSEEGTKLRTEELFQAHQFISDLQNQVVTSIRTRCHSPTS